MKKIIIFLFTIVILIIVAIIVNFMPASSNIESSESDLLSDFLITVTPEVLEYNNHKKSHSESSKETDIGNPWNYKVNGIGVSFESIKDVNLEHMDKIQYELKNNEYYCFVDDDIQHILFPWRVEFEGDMVEEIAKNFNLDQLKIRGYQLIKINGDYEYREEEIYFIDGETQTLELDTTRFYPKGVVFENSEGHMISIMADKHSKSSCHVFYHQDVSEYQLLKTNHLDWWIFDHDGMPSFVSFQNNGNSQYDLFISEGMPTEVSYEGKVYQGLESKWAHDFLAYKQVLDQLGDLSQLDTKMVGFSGMRENNSEIVITQTEME